VARPLYASLGQQHEVAAFLSAPGSIFNKVGGHQTNQTFNDNRAYAYDTTLRAVITLMAIPLFIIIALLAIIVILMTIVLFMIVALMAIIVISMIVAPMAIIVLTMGVCFALVFE
jgi:uncharacterized membrane protein